jgi:uncharacterized protein with HEPN domain
MERDDTVYLLHILDAIGQVESYLEGVSPARFLRDKLRQDAVVRQLEIVGEATSNVSTVLRQAHPEVPWGSIIGMRNRMIHAYFNVNLAIVWEVAQNDLPGLKEQVKLILQTMGRSNS